MPSEKKQLAQLAKKAGVTPKEAEEVNEKLKKVLADMEANGTLPRIGESVTLHVEGVGDITIKGRL
jgi:hypothetical protein